MSLSLLKVPTLNWKGIELGHDDTSDEEHGGEIELTGVWKYPSSWADPEDDWSPIGEWTFPPPPAYKPEEGADEDEEEGEPLLLRYPRAPHAPTRRQKSCAGRIETFSGKTTKNRPGISTGETETTFLSFKLVDTLPGSGFRRPRFVYETESDREEDYNSSREVKLIQFSDNSVIDSQIRIWRQTAAMGGNERIDAVAEEEEDIEDILSLEVLEALQPLVGKKALTYHEYKAVFAKVLEVPERILPKCVGELFTKIDTFGVGKILWDDFCDFLQQKYAERAETQYSTPPIDVVIPCHAFETGKIPFTLIH